MKYLQQCLLRQFGLELELDQMENFWTTDIELKLGEPVDCST